MKQILIKDLNKKYKNFSALKNVNISINENEVFGLLGPNGAGKSTLISVLSGLSKPTSGDIFINGINATKYPSKIKRIIGVAPQKDSLYENLTVRENIEYFGSLYSLSKKVINERSDYLMRLFSLDSKRNAIVRELSGGMKKKLNILCSLIHGPKILILDEPTSGLDTISKHHLWKLIGKINSMGTTIIITSHLMEDIEALCKRIAILVSGNLVVEGSLHELKTFLDIMILMISINPQDVERSKNALSGRIEFEVFDNVITIRTKNPQETYNFVSRIIDPSTVIDVETILPSIEDVFVHFVGKECES
jgi:ABC-2 type transport system ATP-binding protein